MRHTRPGELPPAEQSARTMDDGGEGGSATSGAGFQCAGSRSMTDGGLGWHAGCTVTHGDTNTPRTRFRAPRD